MAQQAQRKQVQDVSSRQEGNRWIGERPSGEDLAKWFKENVRLDQGMDPQDWVGGITLISSTETIVALHEGEFVNMQRLVHVPYARVDARIAYFWALCEEREWTGVIEPVAVPRLNQPGYYNEHLPPGFAKLPIGVAEGRSVQYVTCTQKVTIYEKDLRAGIRGRILKDPPPATKQVQVLDRFGKPDANLMMKAETGAIGRALGMAGIFVLPGSGVATAEDMMEFLGAEPSVASPAEPELPDDSGREIDPEARIAELIAKLDAERPAEMEQVRAWAAEKEIDLSDLRPSQVRVVLRKLEGIEEPADA